MTTPEKMRLPQEPELAAATEQDCAAFQQSMAARIAAGDNFEADAHLKNCPRCKALLEELETIAQAARLLLPVEEEPDDKLWQKIEQAISSDRS